MSSNIPSCCTGYTPQVTFFDVVRLKLLLSYCDVALSQLGEGKCLDAGVLVQTGVLAGVLIQTDANCCVSTISAFIHRSAARKVVALLLQSGSSENILRSKE